MSHLDEGMLHAFLDGELGAAEAAELERHLTGCRDCQARLEEARIFRDQAFGLIETLDEAEMAGAEPMLLLREPGLLQVAREMAATPAPAQAPAPAPAAAESVKVIPIDPKIRQGSRVIRWARPIAWAATVVLAVGIGYQLGADRGVVQSEAPLAAVEMDSAADQLAKQSAATPAPAPIDSGVPAESAPANVATPEETDRAKPKEGLQDATAEKRAPAAPPVVALRQESKDEVALEAEKKAGADQPKTLAKQSFAKADTVRAATDLSALRNARPDRDAAAGVTGSAVRIRGSSAVAAAPAAATPAPAGVAVVGTVVSHRGDELAGAQILVEGNATSLARTDARGRFSLTAPSDSALRLRVTRIGYRPTTVEARPGEDLRVVMTEMPLALDELVTTSVGNEPGRRALGNAVGKVSKSAPVQIRADEAIALLGGTIRLLDGMTPWRYERIDSLVRVNYRTQWGALLLEEWRDDGEVLHRIIAPLNAPSDTVAAWAMRIR